MQTRNVLRRAPAACAASLAAGLVTAGPAAAGLVDGVAGNLPGGVVPPVCVLAPGGALPPIEPGVTLPGTGTAGAGGAGAGQGAAPDSQADRLRPRVRVSARGGRLSLSLRRGYSVTVACNEACAITGSAAQAGRRSTIARGGARLTRAGKAKLTLRFTSRARRALARKRLAKLTIRVTVTDAAGNRATRRAGVKLKR